MRSVIPVSLMLAALAAAAPPDRHGRHGGYREDCGTSASATSATSTTTSATSTTSSAQSAPTLPFTVIAARSGSPIHLLPMNAGGLSFHLGGQTAAYCPTDVGSSCPPGNVTALTTCYMYVEVPGGQAIWGTSDGAIGYTQAHSIAEPNGSLCPFSYSKEPGEQFGHLTSTTFRADGLMACPNTDGTWQVLAAVPNATVPNGNASSCLGFDALTVDYNSSLPGAWQYV